MIACDLEIRCCCFWDGAGLYINYMHKLLFTSLNSEIAFNGTLVTCSTSLHIVFDSYSMHVSIIYISTAESVRGPENQTSPEANLKCLHQPSCCVPLAMEDL